VRVFEGERDLRFDILTSHGKTGRAASASTASEKSLEKITKSACAPASAK